MRGPAGTPSRPRCVLNTAASSSFPIRAPGSSASPIHGALWRSRYDMPPDAFAAELDRLWLQVRPLVSVASRLRSQEAARKLRRGCGSRHGPIPADLLGNMWAQEWNNIYPLVAPKDADPGYNLTAILKERKTDAVADGPLRRALLRIAGFPAACPKLSGSARCSSSRATARWSAMPALGTSILPTICGSRCASTSMMTDFRTIHHELGHNFYQRAYNKSAVPVPRQRQ